MIYTEFIEKIRNNEVNLGIIGLSYVGIPVIHFKELGCLSMVLISMKIKLIN